MHIRQLLLVATCLLMAVVFANAQDLKSSPNEQGVRRVRKFRKPLMESRSGGPGMRIRRRKMRPRPQLVKESDLSVEAKTESNVIETSDAPLLKKKMKVRRKKLPELKLFQTEHQHLIPSATTPPPTFRQSPPVVVEKDDGQPNNRSKDESRFLSLFTIVSFQNDPCTSGSGNNGTCYSSSDCARLGGSSSGSCASGFGVCCLLYVDMGLASSSPVVLTAVTSGASFARSFSVKVTQIECNSLVRAPSGCLLSYIGVSGQVTSFNFQPQNVRASRQLSEQDYRICIRPEENFCGIQYTACPDPAQVTNSGAPDGCLQYFTGVSGQILSFNYNSGSGLQLSNTDYSVCVRMERNFCGIQYNACTDTVNTPAMSFSITGGNPALGSVVGTSCNTDWITIPCATNSNSPTQTGTPSICVDRICGMVFNSVTTAAGSPSVPVNTNDIQTQLDERSQSFTLTGTFGPFGNPVNNAYRGAGGVVGSNLGSGNTPRPYCDTDWLAIPCVTNFQPGQQIPASGSNNPNLGGCVDRLCGGVFNSVQTQTVGAEAANVALFSFMKPFNLFVHTDSLEGSSAPAESSNRGFCFSKPFLVRIHTDGGEGTPNPADTSNRGFCLNYIQQPCTSSVG
ncbi:hypothetical protein TCAL_11572 [Tigriopus californicus]|uniref:CUB domain-containing protein n=1 Tax=Tigriopus californicus TaxID=6832 RepID=A0A553NCR0_TIGCA|nr:hypothetical protein TCAL_11572 [Tigriopus californicus]